MTKPACFLGIFILLVALILFVVSVKFVVVMSFRTFLDIVGVLCLIVCCAAVFYIFKWKRTDLQ
jgi:hypothetical protein